MDEKGTSSLTTFTYTKKAYLILTNSSAFYLAKAACYLLILIK